MIEYVWLIAIVGGPLVLAAAFIYALMRQRRLTRGERQAQARATKALYDEQP